MRSARGWSAEPRGVPRGQLGHAGEHDVGVRESLGRIAPGPDRARDRAARARRADIVDGVSDDDDLAEQIRVTVLHEGRVLADGDMDQVQNDPRVIEVYLGE